MREKLYRLITLNSCIIEFDGRRYSTQSKIRTQYYKND